MATPPIGWYRINFDGAVFVKEIVVGLGSMIRNENSLIMAALSQKKSITCFNRYGGSASSNMNIIICKGTGFRVCDP